MKNRQKINVLHIITNLPVGGAQDNTLLTVQNLNRTKYAVSLLCSSDGLWLERAKKIKSLNLIFVDALTRKIQIINDFIAFCKILKITKNGEYDIVHSHSSKPGFLGRIAAKLSGVPVIIHTIHGFPFHDYMNRFNRWLFIFIEQFLSRISDKLITVSHLNLEKAVQLRLAEPGKFVNIYSGIDFKKFDVKVNIDVKRKEFGIVNGEKIVGLVGRFSSQKSPLDFIKAIPSVLKVRNDVRFVLVGDGELRQEISKLIKKLNIESKTLILGFRDDVPELLYIFDVYVLTSLWEGLGRSLTEAMYTGRPVVATNVDGVPELVKNDETGILVHPGDIAAISQGIITLLNDEDKAKRLGEAAKKHVSESFSVEKMVNNIEKLYDELLQQKQPTGSTISHKHAQKA